MRNARTISQHARRACTDYLILIWNCDAKHNIGKFAIRSSVGNFADRVDDPSGERCLDPLRFIKKRLDCEVFLQLHSRTTHRIGDGPSWRNPRRDAKKRYWKGRPSPGRKENRSGPLSSPFSTAKVDTVLDGLFSAENTIFFSYTEPSKPPVILIWTRQLQLTTVRIRSVAFRTSALTKLCQ